jgi:hypothetical protein
MRSIRTVLTSVTLLSITLLAGVGLETSGLVPLPAALAYTGGFISAGGYHTCGIKTDGTVACWGSNDSGQVSPIPAGPFGPDTTAPSITCGSADGQWNATDVSITCTASDTGSGLAHPATDASFHLTTTVPAGTETATASTGTHQVCDLAGNCATAGPIGGNRIDKKAPSITITSPTTGPYLLGQVITTAYACQDGGSGPASCSGPVATGSTVTASTPGISSFTVTAKDKVGNASNQTVHYAVRYGTTLLHTAPGPLPVGSTIPIQLELTNAAGRNLSSPGITVQALCVVVAGATDCSSAARSYTPPQRFVALGGHYQFLVRTSGLTAGTSYQLLFRVAGEDANSYHVDANATFTLTR